MVIKIIGTLIGAFIVGIGIYYLVKERHDKESRKIYSIISGIGLVMFIGMLLLTLLSI